MSDNSRVADASKSLEHLIDFFCFWGKPENKDDVQNVRFLALEIPQDAGYVALDEDEFSVDIASIEERTKLTFFPTLNAADRELVEEEVWDSWQ